MRKRTTLCVQLMFLLMLVTSGLGQSGQKSETSGGAVIKATGCVKPGVEGGCLILRDGQTKKVYNLLFSPSDKKPDVEMVISFEGRPHQGPTICMQGVPVDVAKWTQLKMKCPNNEGASMDKTVAGKCSGWQAWHDRQPPNPPTLHVTGECTFSTTGYKVKLVPHAPQGINPGIYILDRVVQVPAGIVGQMVTTEKVEYNEKTNALYHEVQIEPDRVTIPVKEVQ